jgi:hypothetical protein
MCINPLRCTITGRIIPTQKEGGVTTSTLRVDPSKTKTFSKAKAFCQNGRRVHDP